MFILTLRRLVNLSTVLCFKNKTKQTVWRVNKTQDASRRNPNSNIPVDLITQLTNQTDRAADRLILQTTPEVNEAILQLFRSSYFWKFRRNFERDKQFREKKSDSRQCNWSEKGRESVAQQEEDRVVLFQLEGHQLERRQCGLQLLRGRAIWHLRDRARKQK